MRGVDLAFLNVRQWGCRGISRNFLPQTKWSFCVAPCLWSGDGAGTPLSTFQSAQPVNLGLSKTNLNALLYFCGNECLILSPPQLLVTPSDLGCIAASPLRFALSCHWKEDMGLLQMALQKISGSWGDGWSTQVRYFYVFHDQWEKASWEAVPWNSAFFRAAFFSDRAVPDVKTPWSQLHRICSVPILCMQNDEPKCKKIDICTVHSGKKTQYIPVSLNQVGTIKDSHQEWCKYWQSQRCFIHSTALADSSEFP